MDVGTEDYLSRVGCGDVYQRGRGNALGMQGGC